MVPQAGVMGMPGAPRSKGPKYGKLGAGSLEHLRSKIRMEMKGLASAWMLCPHGLLVPYFKRTRLGGGPARARGNNAQKEEQEDRRNTWGYLILWLRKPIYYKRLY